MQKRGQRGMTLVELIVAFTILALLSTLTVPLARYKVKRDKERDLRYALREVVASFPVYRSYVAPGRVSEVDRLYIEQAVDAARRRSRAADVSVFDFMREVMLGTVAEGRDEGYRNGVIAFAMKLQQYTAPVMAKGMEDTTFYIYARLVSLNEVGGDPRAFGVPVLAFHRGPSIEVPGLRGGGS